MNNTEDKGEKTSKYGQCTIGYGSSSQRKVDIKDFIRFEYKDYRLISVFLTEEGYGISIENPESTGRAVSQSMLLTEETLVGLVSSIMMYLTAKEVDFKKIFENAVEEDCVHFSLSDNIDPAKLTQNQ